jgi:surface carbohydrate biosynthesis protein
MSKPMLIIPVENQVRELDAKLLLACVAAQTDYRCLIGWKGLIDARIGRFPPSIYLAKSMTRQNLKILRIKRKLGHQVAAWDEEAVVHYPRQIYYARRVGSESLKLIDLFIAWGEDNRELLEGHPEFDGAPIHVLGNPRSDLLRPEFRDFYAEQVDSLRYEHGDFVLINTNFGSVNGYSERLNLLQKVNGEAGEWVLGRHALGMPPDYARGLFHHRAGVLREFQGLIKAIARADPRRKIVVRPHPAEDHGLWRRWCAELTNVEVNAEGNVIPWLLAAGCLVHNGCTTAVEAYLLGTKIISFVPLNDDRYEFGLPNELGDRAASVDEVIAMIGAGAAGQSPESCRAKRELVSRYICSLEGTLASQKIVDVVTRHFDADRRPPRPMARLKGVVQAEFRAANKRLQRMIGVARYDGNFMRQRFPDLTVANVQERADRLTRLIGGDREVRVSLREHDLFETRAV